MSFIRPPCAVRTAKSSFIFSFRLFFLRRVCYNDFRLVEKVPFCRFAAVCFCSLLPSHPARGRRIIFYSSQFNAWPHLLHPARGRRTKHIVIEVKKQIARVTPRKGTQTTAPLYCTFLCGEAGQLLFLCNFGWLPIFFRIISN